MEWANPVGCSERQMDACTHIHQSAVVTIMFHSMQADSAKMVGASIPA